MQAGQPSPVSNAIFVGADPHPPSATQLGHPENFSGTLVILDNDFDVGGMAGTQALGVVMFNVGRSADKEVYIDVSGNKIRNVTEPAINFRVIGGRVYVERNVLISGSVSGGTANPDVIRVVGAGSYLVAHNSIDCGWPDTTATGIDMIGQPPPLAPEAGAVVMDNVVTMSAPEDTVFGALERRRKMYGRRDRPSNAVRFRCGMHSDGFKMHVSLLHWIGVTRKLNLNV
jgi:hypothetical protein